MTQADATQTGAVRAGVTRVGAIDCGTNSIRLLIADLDPAAGTLVDLDRRMEVVRLGQGVDRTGEIAPEAMARTLEATARYAELCKDAFRCVAPARLVAQLPAV